MKKITKLVAVLAVVAFMASCTTVRPVNATANPVGQRVGTSQHGSLLGVFHFNGGDAGIQTAARNGGITRISTVDHRTTNILGIWWTFETVVTGE